jgi:anaerobic selenocysteine-containing dehydrogenase
MIKNVILKIGLSFNDLKASGTTQMIPGREPYFPGMNINFGLRTPSKKIELYSETIAKYSDEYDLDPLPTYRDSLPKEGAEEYPLILDAGGRISSRFHSRFHDVKSVQIFRPYPAADIHPDDAAALGISQGDDIAISTPHGTIHVKAQVTVAAKRGVVFMYQDYADEADVNRIIPWDHLDPYSGFPGYRTMRCRVEKEERA